MVCDAHTHTGIYLSITKVMMAALIGEYAHLTHSSRKKSMSSWDNGSAPTDRQWLPPPR